MSGGDESSARRKKTNAVRLKRTSEHRGSVLDHRTKRLEEPEVKRRTFRPGGRKRWWSVKRRGEREREGIKGINTKRAGESGGLRLRKGRGGYTRYGEIGGGRGRERIGKGVGTRVGRISWAEEGKASRGLPISSWLHGVVEGWAVTGWQVLVAAGRCRVVAPLDRVFTPEKVSSGA